MEYEEFRRVLDEQAGERSQLAEDAHEVGRRVANLPD